ncbi:MAG: Holliday junction branch migration protein RuvA [Lentisphaerae bacterium]|nr:MAG: Holliday junction branch migration protein RuvA [Lentisphaerota bacterium]
MICHLRGTLWYKAPERVVVDVNGVGYEVQIPLSTYDRLPPEKEEVMLFTVYRMRQDFSVQLYGFALEAERALFVVLSSRIASVGPKIALNILSAMSVERFCEYILSGDIKALTAINGVGKKTAQLMVVELKDKLSELLFNLPKTTTAGQEETTNLQTIPKEAEEAIQALIALGIRPDDARNRVRHIVQQHTGETLDTQTLLRMALSHG